MPATCEVRDWPIFGPGHHKGELYTPERCRRMAANFARLRGVLVPTVRIGHDKSQRLAKSLGFVNAGRFAGVTCDASGTIRLTLTGIPTRVGAQVNAGWLNSGSVELKSAVPDPSDPSKKLPGDVIVGVALLGEEQPALPGYAAPRAVFADGTEVPPAEDADDWLTAMADVVTTMAAESRAAAAEDPTTVICFSEMSPMTRDQIIQALMGKGIDVAADPELAAKSDADLKTLLDTVGTSGFSAGMKKMFAAGPDVAAKKEPDGDEPPAYFAAFADECKKMFGDLTGRVGAMEADRTMARGCLPDYLLKFRAPGENEVPVDSTGEVSRNEWIRWAEACWDDIKETDTLNVKGTKGDGDTKHICPLQLDVIDRLVRLYSNPGELVFSPFAGIGSEGYAAVKRGRRFYGCELKEEYHAAAVKNLAKAARAAETDSRTPDLFAEAGAS